jgi:nitroimidazol reductase NimA-like FMN-containing flavoprotein (pyridoxamine 5'-phosphate oxidase superfamily)
MVDGKVYFASGDDGRKVLNIRENPRVAVTVDLYSEDWANLKGVMIQGAARLIERGPRFRRIRRLLYDKYLQYASEAALDESDSMIVEVVPDRVFTWGLDE